MGSFDIQYVMAECPECGAANRITGSDVPSNSVVKCSQCNGIIGRWGHLKAQLPVSETQAAGQADAPEVPGEAV